MSLRITVMFVICNIWFQGQYFVVYDLRFGCRYLVRMQPVSAHRVTGDVAYVSLSTPYCWQADIVGDFTPDCPSNGTRSRVYIVSSEQAVECTFLHSVGLQNVNDHNIAFLTLH